MGQTEAQKRYYKTPKGKAAKKRGDAARYAKNKEAIKARVMARYHDLSPDERPASVRSPGMDKENKKQINVEENARLKLEVLLAYGGECACCGNDFLPHLTLDHIHGGGSKHRKQESSRVLYRRLRREGFPQGEFQVLCWNCNMAKHHLGRCSCQDGVPFEVPAPRRSREG